MHVENSVYGVPAVPVAGDGLGDKGLNVTPVGVNFICILYEKAAWYSLTNQSEQYYMMFIYKAPLQRCIRTFIV